MKNFFTSLLGSLTALFIYSFLSVFIVIAIIAGVSASATQGTKTEVKTNSILELRLEGQITERLTDENELLANFTLPGQEDIIKVQGLNNILTSIKAAATDPNIKGIYIRSNMFAAGFSTLKEIRDALIEFKTSGKFIVAYADNYSQKGYYIASVADKVYINPIGMLDIHGLSSQTMFLKKTLEKVGVEMTIIKHGKYKSAVEPFLGDKMSEESKEQTTILLNDFWNIYCNEINASRNVSKEMLDRYANQMGGLQNTQIAINYKLIDKTMYYDEMSDELKRLSGREDKKIRSLSTAKYASQVVTKTETQDEIAIIYASGAIDGGSSSNEGINSKKLVETIRKAREDDDIKAIVLRINSPGGSAYGSEQIWREVTLAREGKPFIVSMGDVAASGGYYIACAAHSIVAQPNTITGSIGIFGMFPNISQLDQKLGLTFDGVKTNLLADFLNPNRPVTTAEKRILQNYIENGYDNFITRCADGRHTTKEAIDKIGQGRVWSGEDAKDLGLVDKLGNINDAITLAAEMAGLEDYNLQELPKAKPLIESLMESLNAQVKTSMMKVRYGEAYKVFEYATRIKGMQGIQARMPYEIEIY